MVRVSGVPYEVQLVDQYMNDISELERENRMMRARMERLEDELRVSNELLAKVNFELVNLKNPSQSSQTLSKIQSPCVNLCEVAHGTAFCRGCGRSVIEIEAWHGYSDPAKAAIIKKAKLRLGVLNGEV